LKGPFGRGNDERHPSAAVRAAAECPAALPVEEIKVAMQADLLDRGSGPIFAEPVLCSGPPSRPWPPSPCPAPTPPPGRAPGRPLGLGLEGGFRPISLGEVDVPRYERKPYS